MIGVKTIWWKIIKLKKLLRKLLILKTELYIKVNGYKTLTSVKEEES